MRLVFESTYHVEKIAYLCECRHWSVASSLICVVLAS
jgi:hypothetical protein